jgi:acyl carrier protein
MNIDEQVIQAIAETLAIKSATILPEHRFAENLSCDSLDMVEIVMALENKFNIDIPDEKIDDLKFVHQAIELVTSLTGQKIAAAAPLATCGDNA